MFHGKKNIVSANFNDEVVSKLPVEVTTGIYYGWAKLASESEVRKAVVSIGWNPYYHNVKKSVVSHPALLMWKRKGDLLSSKASRKLRN